MFASSSNLFFLLFKFFAIVLQHRGAVFLDLNVKLSSDTKVEGRFCYHQNLKSEKIN